MRPLSPFFVCSLLLCMSIVSSVHADENSKASFPVLSGVGIALGQNQGKLIISNVVAGSTAEKSGRVHKGDQLISIEVKGDRTSAIGKSVGDVASRIRGPSGTEVVLVLLSFDSKEEKRITLKREPLALEGIDGTNYSQLIGKPIPDLQFKSIERDEVFSLAKSQGKIVVLDFWASWCPTCYAPIEELQELSKKRTDWKGKVELITVSVDEDRNIATKVINKKNWNQTINLSIELDSLKGLKISVLPVTIIIRQDGTIATMTGSHAMDVEREVEALLPVITKEAKQ